MLYRILADAVMLAHFLFLVYLVVGGFLAWRWPKAWFPHAAVAAYGLVITAYGFVCPLTPLENDLRGRAGEDGLEPTGFIDTYIEGVVYPEEHTLTARAAAAVVIAVSWIGAYLRHRRRRGRGQAGTGTGSRTAGGSGTGSPPRRSHDPRTASASSSEPTVMRWFRPPAAAHHGEARSNHASA